MRSDYCEGKVHIIEEGDTLYKLSRSYEVPLALILRANPFTDVYNLQVGDEVCIPVQIGMRPERPNRPGNEMRPERPNRPGNEMRPERPNRPGNEMESERPNSNESGMRPSRPSSFENGMNLGRGNNMGNNMPSNRLDPEDFEDVMEEIEEEFEEEQKERGTTSSNQSNNRMSVPPTIAMPQMPNMDMANPNRPVTLPSFPNLFSYIVEEGETLEDILDNFDVNLEDLLDFNDLDEIMLLPGSVVKVPIRKENKRS